MKPRPLRRCAMAGEMAIVAAESPEHVEVKVMNWRSVRPGRIPWKESQIDSSK